MATMRILYLYPEASDALAPLFPEFSSSVIGPRHLWQLAYETETAEESPLGVWLHREQSVSLNTDNKEQRVEGRVLIPWRFVATVFEFELGENSKPSHVLGFQAPRVFHVNDGGRVSGQ